MAKRAILLLLLAGLLAPPLAAGPDDPDEKATKKADRALRKLVNRSIQRGADWLGRQQRGDGSFPSVYSGAYPMGPTALSLLALLHSGVPRSDPGIRRGFEYLRGIYDSKKKQPAGMRQGLRTYSVAITVMALAQYGWERRAAKKEDERYGNRGGAARVGGKPDLEWMKEMTEWLVGVQRGNGAWRYPEGGYDNSNTQYALLALKEARRVGIRVPDKVFAKALDHFLDEQEKSGPRVRRQEEVGGDGVYAADRKTVAGHDRARGWPYVRGGQSTGSMTTAGVAAVAIAKSELNPRRWGRTIAKAEQSMRDGLAWLGLHFSVLGNPVAGAGARGRPGWHYYYLYGLERAGVLARVVYMGSHRWYAEGARYLVDAQSANGSWNSGPRGGPRGGFGGMGAGRIVDHCFALLFLTRSTSRSFGVSTERPLTDLTGRADLDDKALADLFRAAFREMDELTDEEAADRARDFALLGPRVIGLLLRKLPSADEAVRARAIRILRTVTGKEMGFDPAGDLADREAAADEWMRWYLVNRKSLSLDEASRIIR